MSSDESELIVPDYYKPRERVFAEATFAAVTGPTGAGDLDILKRVTLLRPTQLFEGLPTWALNFDGTVFADSPPWYYCLYELKFSERYILPSQDAAISSDGRRLHLNVVLLDTIDVAEKIIVSADELTDSDLENLQVPNQIGTAVNFGRHNKEDVSVREQTLPNNRQKATQARSGSSLWHLFEWWETHMAVGASVPGIQSSIPPKDDFIAQLGFFANICGLDPSLFLTTGGLLGLAPRAIDSGDVFALTKDLGYALLLHDVGGAYKLRGLAFVPGIGQDRLQWFWEHNEVRASRIVRV